MHYHLNQRPRSRIRKPRWWLGAIGGGLLALILWLTVTNPYGKISIIRAPYTTSVSHGTISVHKQFSLTVYNGTLADTFGYWVKDGFLLLQNTLFGSRPTKARTTAGIISEIHAKRFDPTKPYLISGDQFSVLYPRNLGVFYNDLLNPNTALSQADWDNRQRIYLQSALYALDAFSTGGRITTTVEPVSPHAVVLAEVHPGSVASDSLYGILYALHALQDDTRYAGGPYRLETVAATRAVIAGHRGDLKRLLALYLDDVRDPATGLVKRTATLSGARDGVHRQGSFYDNVILWRTLGLAKQLGVSDISDADLATLRNTILATYWDEAGGHFIDDFSPHAAGTNYSSDWLIALPAGLLSPDSLADLPYLQRSVAFMRAQGVTKPLPVKYTEHAGLASEPWATRTFVPNYGSDAIWSYWGAQYLTLLASLYHQTGDQAYRDEATSDIDLYNQKIVQYRGFPETFTPDGDFLSSIFYKSIRQTGWVVQFETAVQELGSPL
ncbi:MAG TPA: hypothetical protein VHQ86_05775 [Candidatus Saccharimonadia bacterium]|nr:hypothetical protein [Candidatus Saccharimonadia bacterium]